MRTQNIPFRLVSALAIAGLLLGPASIAPALAQAENPAAADPPARVGRLASITGTVSFHTADETEWQPATLNYPVTSGNSFWTEPGASAEIEVGATHLALGAGSEFDIDTLDDHTLAATAPQGTIYVGARDVPQGDSYQIGTPRGTVTIAAAGRYAINAGDTDHPTTVTVEEGAAQLSGPGLSGTVGAQQTAVITGTDTFQATVGPEQPDPALAALLGPVAPPPPAGTAAPPVIVAEMTGGDALAETGSWAATPDNGQVWYPPVAAGWAPYREGHWAFVAPWGWTWVDDASWGFAPFHYGRWVHEGPRWGWVPAEPGVAVSIGPVYSPALVSFVGFGAGVGVGLAIGASVGWIPLGPREPYFPPYRHSDGYLRNVNVHNVTNVTHITNITNVNRFANYRSATMVPSSAMTGSQPIARNARPITPQALAAARPVTAPPVRPTAATAGVTPAVARQYNIPRPAPGTVAGRPAAPGPAVQPHAPGAATLRPPGGAPSVVPSAARPGASGPAIAPRPPVASGTPGARPALPALRPTTPAGTSRPTGTGAPGPAIAPRPPAGAGGVVGAPAPRPAAPTPGTAAVPHAAPVPQVSRPTPAARPAAPSSPQVQHAAPAVQHAAPAVQHAAPTVQHAAPAVQHAAPAVQHAAPAVQHAAPVVQHAAPAVQHAAPAVQHAAPAVQHAAPPPAQHAAPPAAAKKACPQGKTTC
jgi:hypothetical protein